MTIVATETHRVEMQRATVAEHGRASETPTPWFPPRCRTCTSPSPASTTCPVSVVEATITGTHCGDWCGLPASGRHVSFELCAIFVFGDGPDAGKLVRERAYWDNETLLRQMRGEVDAPTGEGSATVLGI
jgi:hypothetical protein